MTPCRTTEWDHAWAGSCTGSPPLLFIAYALVAGFAPVMDNVDLGWHVAQGRWMAAALRVLPAGCL